MIIIIVIIIIIITIIIIYPKKLAWKTHVNWCHVLISYLWKSLGMSDSLASSIYEHQC